MSFRTTARHHEPAAAFLLIVLTVLACGLRFWRLGEWGFDSDETFTLRDSLSPQLSNPRPLLYFLNHYVVGPILPLNEFGLRVLPALFGTLAIPTVYLVGRRLIGARAALFAAVLLTASPLHVYYSQFARYWTLVFLLSAIYPYALYLGLRDRNRAALAVGSLTFVLAALAHPTSVLLFGGFGLWFVLTYLRGADLRQWWSQRTIRWGMVLSGALATIIIVRFLPMLQMWILMHDSGNTSEFLMHLPGKPGLKQFAYVLSYVESLTLPLVLASMLGLYFLWQSTDRSLALLLVCMLVFPVAFLALLSLRTPVSTFYLVPPIPIVFLGAGIFLDRLTRIRWEVRPDWLVSAAVVLIIVAAGAPTLVSQFRDGRRYDFRSMANWLSKRIVTGDIVFSDQPKVINHYLPKANAQYLRGDPAALAQSLRALDESGSENALWVIAPAPAHAFRTNPKVGHLRRWIFDHCQLRNTIGVGRLDFRQYHLQVYRCPATPLRTASGTIPK